MKISGQDKGDWIFELVNNFFLALALLVVLYPIYYILIASISNPDAVNTGQVWIVPIDVTWEGYSRIFADPMILSGYRNTLFYTFTGTLLNILITMMLAYPLSRRSFFGKKAIMVFITVTMYFDGGLIPTYMLVKSLGLYNNWMVMIILGAVSVFNVIIARTFLQSNIPEELYEAATIDGCSHIVFFIKMVLPLSKAIIAVLALYYGVRNWNEFMKALIYLSDENKYPLQLFLRRILILNQAREEMTADIAGGQNKQKIADLIKFGVIIVSSMPVLILYPFLQKYFIKGIMIGSLKG